MKYSFFFLNRCILIIEIIKIITFIEMIDLWKWLLKVLQQYESEKKFWWYVNVCANLERGAILNDSVIYIICSRKYILCLLALYLCF